MSADCRDLVGRRSLFRGVMSHQVTRSALSLCGEEMDGPLFLPPANINLVSLRSSALKMSSSLCCAHTSSHNSSQGSSSLSQCPTLSPSLNHVRPTSVSLISDFCYFLFSAFCVSVEILVFSPGFFGARLVVSKAYWTSLPSATL